jgi:hypothetical protein
VVGQLGKLAFQILDDLPGGRQPHGGVGAAEEAFVGAVFSRGHQIGVADGGRRQRFENVRFRPVQQGQQIAQMAAHMQRAQLPAGADRRAVCVDPVKTVPFELLW